MPSTANEPTICFDDEYRVRVLEVDKFKHTENLEQECNQFNAKMDEFQKIVQDVVGVMETQAKKIEMEKLRAIGQRNRVDSEVEHRAREQSTIKALINEKMAELERYNQEYQSLIKLESEQRALIERLTNNES